MESFLTESLTIEQQYSKLRNDYANASKRKCERMSDMSQRFRCHVYQEQTFIMKLNNLISQAQRQNAAPSTIERLKSVRTTMIKQHDRAVAIISGKNKK